MESNEKPAESKQFVYKNQMERECGWIITVAELGLQTEGQCETAFDNELTFRQIAAPDAKIWYKNELNPTEGRIHLCYGMEQNSNQTRSSPLLNPYHVKQGGL